MRYFATPPTHCPRKRKKCRQGTEVSCLPAFRPGVCWVVGGTYCDGRVQGTFAQKCEDCRKCSFYQKVVSGEI
ncbi:MAG: two-CW domain-containing protein [Thermodesulfovibrionales bacterium]